MSKVAVLGGGSWGTAFGAVLADAGAQTTIWARRDELARAIDERHVNDDYLPGVELPPLLHATTDVAAALDGAEFVVLAVPSQTLRDNLRAIAGKLPADAPVISLMKGIELETNKRMSEVICEVADIPAERVAVVSGPNLAKEIAARLPAASVIACVDHDVAVAVQDLCSTRYFRLYTNTDVVGCELGGAVKNVIALAVGIAIGMGFGDNATASLITRGLAETSRLGESLGADPMTFAGLAGMGDLVATCSSPLSRNRTFGENLGRGLTLEQTIAATKQTAEGVKSSRAILALARKHDVVMPITEQVVHVVHEGGTTQDMLTGLMSRDPRHERDHPDW